MTIWTLLYWIVVLVSYGSIFRDLSSYDPPPSTPRPPVPPREPGPIWTHKDYQTPSDK